MLPRHAELKLRVAWERERGCAFSSPGLIEFRVTYFISAGRIPINHGFCNFIPLLDQQMQRNRFDCIILIGTLQEQQ
jgi:hypothetical protein